MDLQVFHLDSYNPEPKHIRTKVLFGEDESDLQHQVGIAARSRRNGEILADSYSTHHYFKHTGNLVLYGSIDEQRIRRALEVQDRLEKIARASHVGSLLTVKVNPKYL